MVVKNVLMEFEGTTEIICRQEKLKPREGKWLLQSHTAVEARANPETQVFGHWSCSLIIILLLLTAMESSSFCWTLLPSQTPQRVKMIQEILTHFQRHVVFCWRSCMACCFN